MRLKPYHFYDDPICNCSIAAGAELFDVQKERNCFPEPSARGRLIASAGCRDLWRQSWRRTGSDPTQDYEAGGRSNGADDYFLLSSFGRQGPLSGN